MMQFLKSLDHHFGAYALKARPVTEQAPVPAMGMARTAKKVGLKNPERRVAKREKTEVMGRRTENHPRFDSAGPRQMRQAGIVSQRQGAPFKQTGYFIQRQGSRQGDATVAEFYFHVKRGVPVFRARQERDVPAFRNKIAPDNKEIMLRPLLVFPCAERKEGDNGPDHAV